MCYSTKRMGTSLLGSTAYLGTPNRLRGATSILTKNTGPIVVLGRRRATTPNTSSIIRVDPATDCEQVRTTIEYDWVTIAEQRYLLPVQAEVLMGRGSEQYYTRNVIEFSNYHKFEGKLKVIDQDQ